MAGMTLSVEKIERESVRVLKGECILDFFIGMSECQSIERHGELYVGSGDFQSSYSCFSSFL